MGFNVVPAPEVSGLTGAPGPQGLKGDTGATGPAGPAGATGATGPAGTPGSKVLTGTVAPTATDGVDGDVYIYDDTRTFLGVTSTNLTYYKKVSGAWQQVGGSPVGGSKWYVNTTSTSSTDTKPGDMLLRTDTGDIWQRTASGWGNPIGNLKGPQGATGATGATGAAGPTGPAGATGPTGPQGPKGDTGATGPQGPKGDPGGVTSVNTKTGAVTLNASDVNALPTTGGTLSGEVSVDGAAATYREFSFKTGGVKRWSIQAENSSEAAGDGTGSDFRIFSRNNDGTFNQTGFSITRKWAQTTFGDGKPLGDAKSTTSGAHGLRDMTWEPALPNEGVLLYSQGGKPYAKQGDGTVLQVGAFTDKQRFAMHYRHMLTGGGNIFWNGQYLRWGKRFIALGVGKSTALDTGGYFQIDMPPVGTVIPILGDTATSTTVTSTGIQMNAAAWGVLWYKLPWGGNATSVPANFVITGYRNDMTPPGEDWVMVAAINSEAAPAATYSLKLGTGEQLDHWKSLSYKNGWTSYTTGTEGVYPEPAGVLDGTPNYRGAAYRLGAGRMVEFKGLIKGGTATNGYDICTMPVGYRPYANHIFYLPNNGAMMRVDVYSEGGYITVGTPGIGTITNAWVDLSTIRYPAEK
ncbi:minor tail protein [Streptomyces phage phiScoe54]|nr:minor tail protein [Streptomyces phage phiScoe54]